MKKFISYPFSIVYYVVFGMILCVFHPIQWVCLNGFGYQAHKKSVDYLNFFLIRATHILGTKYKVINREFIPKEVPVIVVSNHQSMYDIPMIIWFLRKLHPKFISKKELGKGIPSVSYNLRHGGSVLIDRKKSDQSIPEIEKLAKYIEKNNRSAVIFPEGTRSRTGEPKKFSQKGLKTLCQNAPSAYILPITINNSWKIVKFGLFPLSIGKKLTLTVHKCMKISDYSLEEILQKTEKTIVSAIII